jgi:lipopolysaccharide transport system permease protein
LSVKKFAQISLVLTKAQMKSRYRKTIAGFLWVVLNPILLFVVHALIFKAILKVSIPNYFMFLLGGLLPWVFITSNMQMTTNTFITQREIIRSFSISPIASLISHIVDNFINFLAAFFILFTFLAIWNPESLVGISFYLLPLATFFLLIFCLSLSTILATIQVYFRDVQFITQFANNILYLLTPIFYPPELIPKQFVFLASINPYYVMIKPFQIILNNYTQENVGAVLLNSFLLSTSFAILSYLVWQKGKKRLYHLI